MRKQKKKKEEAERLLRESEKAAKEAEKLKKEEEALRRARIEKEEAERKAKETPDADQSRSLNLDTVDDTKGSVSPDLEKRLAEQKEKQRIAVRNKTFVFAGVFFAVAAFVVWRNKSK